MLAILLLPLFLFGLIQVIATRASGHRIQHRPLQADVLNGANHSEAHAAAKALTTLLTGISNSRLNSRTPRVPQVRNKTAPNRVRVRSRSDNDGIELSEGSQGDEAESSEELVDRPRSEPSVLEEERLKDELELKRELLGPEDPETLAALANYAFKLHQIGHLDEAEPLLKDLLAFQRRILGKEHPDTVITLEGYVKVLHKLGNELMVEPYMEELLRLTRKVYGPEHPKSQRLWSDHADMISEFGHNFRAETMKKEILDLAIQSLGPEHAHTLRAIRSYADALDGLGRSDEARQYHDAIKQLEQQLSNVESELPARAVFSYGTLRGDYSPDGDRWGVLKKTGGGWKKCRVRGFRLYQESGVFYPFAAEGGDDDELVGTLLEWSEDEDAEYSVRQCNRIEGFDPANPENGLFMRSVVTVDVEGRPNPVKAFIYHRRPPSKQAVASGQVKYFPLGDWLQE